MDKHVAIVSHDAGAANHIIAWLESGLIELKHTKICMVGPAFILLNKSGIATDGNHKFKEILDNCSLLISGTGWSSDIEYNALKKALERGIKTIAVIDHWTNYRERFIRNRKELLPDEIWVVDNYAKSLVKKYISEVHIIKEKPNHYIRQQVNKIKRLENYLEDTRVRVLFLMEPLRIQPKNEFENFDFFITHLDSLNIPLNSKIIIKPHPSDIDGKYTILTKKHSKINIKIDELSSLEQLISWASYVVGYQTYGMIVALAAKKKVASVLHHSAPPCVLPHKKIIHLSKLLKS